MGKIFDALEKAGRRNADAPEMAMKAKNGSPGKKKSEKVVPLVKSTPGFFASQIDKSLVVFHDPHSVEAELFKMLRTNILFPPNGIPPKSILVTSALPGEGKSFISSNLAISIAQGVEEHVLLIDGDIRKPTISSRFGFKKTSGLSEFLSSGDDIAGMLLKTFIEKLTILPAGAPPANPTELMSSKKMRSLLQEVKARYEDRYIIIDSPPPTMASETNAIAKFVDAIIIVVKAEKTPRAAVADIMEQFGKEKVIGVVLNQADQSTRKYYGYGKSYYQNK